MRRLYQPESIKVWENNLLQQGGSLPVYAGVAYQRGQGLGSFFRGIFRTIWPTVKKVGIAAGKEALRTGSEATSDYLKDGIDFKTALKRRGKQALGRAATKIGQKLQHGNGIGKRFNRKTIKGIKGIKAIKTRRKRRKSKKDIFHYD